ncbi:hypothetical protein [Saccharopolyspora griseoalba]|uniref:Uncharacterized protein n=1 Tax=Saccharopolyspora griseoalba TaxID=1431848 RepID=A0ABW2LRM0_9PSEU
MSRRTATVAKVTQARKGDEARTPLVIVTLHCQGRAYFWDAEPGTYRVGQEVQVKVNNLDHMHPAS